MDIFRCDACGSTVYFENVQCLSCGAALGFVPGALTFTALQPEPDQAWRALAPAVQDRLYHPCANALACDCNWQVPVGDDNPLCTSCRLTHTVPDLDVPGHRAAWTRIEHAKRRLLYGLLRLGLPVTGRAVDPEHGLAFDFLADDPQLEDSEPVLTGHANGLITLNIAEADDAERERLRLNLHERYRTLLGHFRHEVGHYYWDRLIAGGPFLDEYRQLFGDEQQDYGQALRTHYDHGPRVDWPEHFVSAYASSHPWEDWAESWAHYFHLTDTLETARAVGLTVATAPPAEGVEPFDALVAQWLPLSAALNELNRSMGEKDVYPFALNPNSIAKLRFVHRVVLATGRQVAEAAIESLTDAVTPDAGPLDKPADEDLPAADAALR